MAWSLFYSAYYRHSHQAKGFINCDYSPLNPRSATLTPKPRWGLLAILGSHKILFPKILYCQPERGFPLLFRGTEGGKLN